MGAAYLLKKKMKTWALLLLIALVLTFILTKVFNPSVVAIIIDIVPILVVIALFWYKSRQVGNQIWEKVKGQPQPVKLDF